MPEYRISRYSVGGIGIAVICIYFECFILGEHTIFGIIGIIGIIFARADKDILRGCAFVKIYKSFNGIEFSACHLYFPASAKEIPGNFVI